MHRRIKDRSLLRRRKLGIIEREVLEDLSGGDLLYGFLLSAHSTSRMFRLARERAMHRYRKRLAIERMLREHLIESSKDTLSITPTGRDALDISVGRTRALLSDAQWDRKWRIVAFDIPQRHARLRDAVRSVLKRAGFIQLQRSVWVFPHECEELVRLIQKESRLAPYILYGVLERIEGEARLKKIFGL